MSVIGTGVAAGVAQSQHQAQQVNRRQQRDKTDAARELRRIRERLDIHLQALDESDEAADLSQLRIDAQVPEHQRQPIDTVDALAALHRQHEREPDDDRSPTPDDQPHPEAQSGQSSTVTNAANTTSNQKPASSPNTKPPDDDQLYRHLDITA